MQTWVSCWSELPTVGAIDEQSMALPLGGCTCRDVLGGTSSVLWHCPGGRHFTCRALQSVWTLSPKSGPDSKTPSSVISSSGSLVALLFSSVWLFWISQSYVVPQALPMSLCRFRMLMVSVDHECWFGVWGKYHSTENNNQNLCMLGFWFFVLKIHRFTKYAHRYEYI